MKLTVKRVAKKPKYTIGKLYIDGEYFCDTLEDTDRSLDQSMTEEEIASRKVYGETAIPTGTYKITMNVVSPKFSKKDFYKKTCNGKLPRLLDVPGFDGILIHVGDGYKGPKLTYGCILVGYNKIVGGLLDGKEVFTSLINKLKKESNITITII